LKASHLTAARGAGEHGFPAVWRDWQANLAEPQRRRLNRSSIGAADEKTPPLIRRDDVKTQRREAYICGDFDFSAIEGAVQTCEHARRLPARLELLDGHRALDFEIAAQPSEQRGRDADRAALVAFGERGG